MTMITSYDTQKVSNALIQAVVMDEIKKQKTAREEELEAENNRLKRELELRKQRDRRIYATFIDDADRYYAAEQQHHWGLNDILWTLYAWLILAFGALFDALGI